jgi:hypothetical protein
LEKYNSALKRYKEYTESVFNDKLQAEQAKKQIRLAQNLEQKELIVRADEYRQELEDLNAQVVETSDEEETRQLDVEARKDEIYQLLNKKLNQRSTNINTKQLQQVLVWRDELQELKVADDVFFDLVDDVWTMHTDKLIEDAMKKPNPAEHVQTVCADIIEQHEIDSIIKAAKELEAERKESQKKVVLQSKAFDSVINLDVEKIQQWKSNQFTCQQVIVEPSANILPTKFADIDQWVMERTDKDLIDVLRTTMRSAKIGIWTHSRVIVELVNRLVCFARGETELLQPASHNELDTALEQIGFCSRASYYNAQNRLLFFHSIRSVVEHGLGLKGTAAEDAMDFLISPLNLTELANVGVRNKLMGMLMEKLGTVCSAGGIEWHGDQVGYSNGRKDGSKQRQKMIKSALDQPD